jgi:uncharacterized protein YggE
MNRPSRLGVVCAVTAIVFGFLTGAAVAQLPFLPNMAASDGISVFGTGEVAARPNVVEIDLPVSGKAELTGDALVKYRDAKKRLVEALDKLGLKELSSEERAVSIGPATSLEQQQRIVGGVPQVAGKPQIEVTSTVRVRLKNVRDVPADELVKTVGRLIDVAQDAGVSVGLSAADIQMRQRYGMYGSVAGATVRFVVADLAELREKAYERAVADARDRAGRLAKLNQVKLGRAVSVQEIQVAGDADGGLRGININMVNPGVVQPTQEATAEPRIASTSLAEIPVQVKLLVRFAIEPADPATASK